MNQQAGVQSIDAVRDFRVALVNFGEQASSAMASTTLETQRFLDWINHDQVKFWQGEIRRREEQLTEAKSALNRKRLAATFGDPPRDSEEQALHKKAVRRLEEAQEKVKRLAKWRMMVDRAVTEYTGQSQQITNYLDGDFPKVVALLERLIARLEEYAGLTTPDSAPASTGVSMARPADASPTAAAAVPPAITPADLPPETAEPNAESKPPATPSGE